MVARVIVGSLVLASGLAAACNGYSSQHRMQSPARSAQLRKFRGELQSFRLTETTMTPERQAEGWLRLFEHEEAIPKSNDGDIAFDPQAILNLAPPPAAWDDFRRLVRAKAANGDRDPINPVLELLADVLEDDETAEYDLIRRMSGSGDENSKGNWSAVFDEVQKLLGGTDSMIQSLRIQAGSFRAEIGVQLPSLLPVLGEARATALLKELMAKAVLAPKHPEWNQGETDPQTLVLADRIANDDVGKLEYPQWEIAKAVRDWKLIDALLRRFPASTDHEGPLISRRYADALEAVDLVVAGHGDEVERGLIRRKGYPLDLAHFDNEGGDGSDVLFGDDEHAMDRAEALYRFLGPVLQRHPGLLDWDAYILAAEQTHHPREMADFLLAALKRGKIPSDLKSGVLGALWQALANLGRIDEAASVMSPLVMAGRYIQLYGYETNSSLGVRLARIGALVGRPDWVVKGLGDISLKQQYVPSEVQEFEKRERPAVNDDDEGLLAWADAFDRGFLWNMAAKRYARYLALHPEDFSVESRLAEIELALEQPEEAKRHYGHVFRLLGLSAQTEGRLPGMPQDRSYPFKDLFFDTFSLRIAVQEFKEAAVKNPERPEPHYWLGEAYGVANRWTAARREFETALRISPSMAAATAGIAESGAHLAPSAAETDETAFAQERRDPQHRNEQTQVKVQDLRKYWTVVAESLKATPPEKLPPFRLSGQLTPQEFGGAGAPLRTVSEAIGSTGLMSIIEQLLNDVQRSASK